jgi:hypothetical protein
MTGMWAVLPANPWHRIMPLTRILPIRGATVAASLWGSIAFRAADNSSDDLWLPLLDLLAPPAPAVAPVLLLLPLPLLPTAEALLLLLTSFAASLALSSEDPSTKWAAAELARTVAYAKEKSNWRACKWMRQSDADSMQKNEIKSKKSQACCNDNKNGRYKVLWAVPMSAKCAHTNRFCIRYGISFDASVKTYIFESLDQYFISRQQFPCCPLTIGTRRVLCRCGGTRTGTRNRDDLHTRASRPDGAVGRDWAAHRSSLQWF